MRQLTLVCQQSSKVLPQSHHILQHSIAHQCLTCSVQVQRQVINCCCCKKCVLACASLAVNKEALACSFSRAPALPLNTHDALIRQEASPSQRLATCLVLIFVLLGCGSQTTIQCKPCRCHKLCSHAPKAHTENVRALFCTQNKRAIIDQASLHSGFSAPCIICTQRKEPMHRFPSTQISVRCKKTSDAILLHAQKAPPQNMQCSCATA